MRRYRFGLYDGEWRLRVARPGFDAASPLTDEQLVFDSAWAEILTVHEAAWAANLPTSENRFNYGGRYWKYPFAYKALSGLSFAPLAMAWVRTAGETVRWWTAGSSMPAFSTTSARTLHPAAVASTQTLMAVNLVNFTPTHGISYIVLRSPLAGADTREAAATGLPRICLGTHPSRGQGFFVSRRGANVRTCGDDDLVLSSAQPPLMAAEAGAYAGTVRYQGVNASGGSLYNVMDVIDLDSSYPDYPPVIVSISGFGTAVSSDGSPLFALTSVHWLSASRICIQIDTGSVAAVNVTWMIPSLTPSYAEAAPVVGQRRWRLDLTHGLRISRRGYDVRTATPAQMLIDSSRSMLHIARRGEITVPALATTGTTPITTTASAAPLGMYSVQCCGIWWTAPNLMSIQMLQYATATGRWTLGQPVTWIHTSGTNIKWRTNPAYVTAVRYGLIDFSTY